MADSGSQLDGFKALMVLNKRFDSKTSASLLQAFLEVVNPQGIKSLVDVVSGIHKWEAKVALLKSRFSKEVDGDFKLAILVGMLPKEFQDMVLQNSSIMTEISYEGSRDYVLSVANQKMQMIRPTPMDVGAVDYRSGDGVSEPWSEEEQDVNAVDRSKVQCFTCKGFGHFSRECPNHTIGGKNGKGGGKGYNGGGGQFGKGGKGDGGKGSGKGYVPWSGNKGNFQGNLQQGNFQKGGGKGQWNQNNGKGGYQGTCFTCGKVGHKSNECRSNVNGVESGPVEAEQCSVEIGGIWNICNVENGSRFANPNSFGVFGSDEDEDEWPEVGEAFSPVILILI
jgi:hypothetical protein